MARSLRHSTALETRLAFDTRDGKMIRYKDDCGVIAAGVLFSASYGNAAIRYGKLAQEMVNRGIYSADGSKTGKLLAFIRNEVAPNARRFYHDMDKTMAEYLLPRPKWTGLLCVKNEQNESHAVAVVDGVIYNGAGWEDARITFSLKTK